MTPKRIVFCTLGSLGDLYPYLALARELKQRGHVPVVATAPAYRARVEAQDVAFYPVRPDLDPNDPDLLRRVMDRRTGGRYVICEVVLPALRESYEDTARAACKADLLVTHPMTLAAFLFAHKSGIPWASTALAPVSLYSRYDPPVLCGFPFAETIATFGPAFQGAFLHLVAGLFEPLWKSFRRFERELGLPISPNPLFWGHSPRLALGLFSPLLGAPQRDWPANAHATGFPFYRHDDGMPPELLRFLNAGDPPIVFTLGSAAVGVAGDFFEQSAEAARRLGRRAVLLVGANQPRQPLPPEVIAVPYAPHAAVFARAAVVVHQGGIGTTGEAMRAGHPMLLVPYSHDQPDHAARLIRMGVARTIRRDRYHPSVAAREIGFLLEDGGYRERAAALGVRVREENGVATACDLICNLLSEPACEPEPVRQLVD